MSVMAASQSAARPVAAAAYDRLFYGGMAVTMALVVFVGFAPSYYLRAFYDNPVTFTGKTTLTPLVHGHGALFTVWVVLFVAQTALIASHRVRTHRRLGIAGAVVGAAMIVVGLKTMIASAALGGTAPGIDPLSFMAIPFVDMVLFATYLGSALWLRRNKEAHKRLMLLAYISIITAAVARWPWVRPLGPLVFFGLSSLLLVAGIAYDAASRRRIHPVYIWGGGLLLLSVPGRLALSGTAAWMAFARMLTG